ncbi:MAG: Rrf2 family transcriptional regulator [Candidatus Cloacimonetes bacterium]|nr:Rrf2 family transcriptional regulator [Candidatus Cloacimonadota bacterium]
MNISTKTEYAVRALAELAVNSVNKPVSINEICKNQNLPMKYIEQLFRKLKQNGLVKSIHGAKGGYQLALKISVISLKDIMEAVDENYVAPFCNGNTEEHVHCIGLPCGFKELWDEINEHTENYFDSIKLNQIVARL